MLEIGKYKEFEEGITMHAEDAFNTTCDICGEWIQYVAKITYNSSANIQSIIIEGESCGEVFRLVPEFFKLEKVKKSELY